MYHIVYLTTNLVNNKIYVGVHSTYNLDDGYLGSGKLISKAKEIHGDKYDYSKTVYTKMNDKILLICKIHGIFLQKAVYHLNGRGCAHCNSGCKPGEHRRKSK